MSRFFTKHSHWVLMVGIILSFVVLSVGSAWRESLTYDEIVHSQEGLNHLQKHTFAIDTYNPPLIRELQMLPVVLGASNQRLFTSRLVTILFGALLLMSVYFVARKYVRKEVALLALFLLAFEPNMLAHSHYVTLDLGTALFFFVAYATLLWFLEWPTRVRSVIFGVSLGLALASRVMVLPYIVASSLLLGLLGKFKRSSLKQIVGALLISLFIVWATYFFRWEVGIAKGGGPGRVSEQLKYFAAAQKLTLLESGLAILENRPLPLGNYLATLKNSFLRGVQNTAKPDWYELPVNIFFKTPIPMLMLITFVLWKLKKGKTEKIKMLIFLMPVLAILGTAAVAGMEPRARYILPVYPFLAIVAAQGVGELGKRREIWGNILLVLLLGWYMGGTIIQYPHFISYANEFLPRSERYLYLTDSNLDWGQSLPDLAHYIGVVKPSHVSFSYFGRDNGNDYGLISNRQWGSYKFEEICAFHEIALPYEGERLVAISVSNWHGCGYAKEPKYAKERVTDIVADSVLIFR